MEDTGQVNPAPLATGTAPGESVVLLQLTLRRFGNSRKGDIQQISTDAEKDLLKLSKRLLDCPQYKAIERHDQDTSTWIRGRSIPSLFKPGIFRVLPERVEAIDGYLDTRLGERADLVEALKTVYQASIDTAKGRLGTQFNPLDYPPVDDLVKQFGLDWQFFTLGPPQQVEGITAGFIARETARLRDIFQKAEEEGLAATREEFAGLVDHLLDRLSPDSDGEVKRFHKSTIANLSEFLDAFDWKNVAGDRDLAKLIRQARGLISGVEVEDIRKDGDTRDTLRRRFDSLKTALDPLVVKGRARFVDPAALAPDAEAEAMPDPDAGKEARETMREVLEGPKSAGDLFDRLSGDQP